MKLSVFKKVCLTVMGVGVVSSLVSVGTFATFTATTTNPGNTFAAGTLTLQDSTSTTSAATTLSAGPNQTGTDARGTQACNDTTATANLVASACTTLLKTVQVAANGLEPGQYLKGAITVKNSGTLPATIAMQVQNATTSSGNGNQTFQITPSASGCPGDVTGATSAGRAATGPQLRNDGAESAFSLCSNLGLALNITIQDAGSSGGAVLTGAGDTLVATGVQCVYGGDGWVSGASAPNGTTQAPLNALSQTYVASGTKAGTGTGTCDPIANSTTTTSLNNLGTPSSAAAGQITRDAFGTGASGFSALSGTNKFIFIPGSSSKKSITNVAAQGGDLTLVNQWLPSESHTFTVTIALPDTGLQSVTDFNGDVFNVSKDDQYQNGAVKFDLLWMATQ